MSRVPCATHWQSTARNTWAARSGLRVHWLGNGVMLTIDCCQRSHADHCLLPTDSFVWLGTFQAKWPAEFKATSSHRFRSGKDMQYAFSYFYFLMHAPRGRMLQHLLRELDTDGDGFFSDNELHTLISTLHVPLK
eukprot:1195989-Prorocentrum_minimum.AAC.1